MSIPRHVAIIMDGNGRWAKERDLPRIEGHKAGVQAVRRTVEACAKLGVRYLTIFSFSTENWKRSREEVVGLMTIFAELLQSELESLSKNGIRLRAIGDLARLPFGVRSALKRVMDATKDNTKLDLVLAISYSGRDEIVSAAVQLAKKVKDGKLDIKDIDAGVFESQLWTKDIPDPDLLIRTSGEQRISNFLLWQLAYSELVVIPELWPDFDEALLQRCLTEYANRERRFGLTSEQLDLAKATR